MKRQVELSRRRFPKSLYSKGSEPDPRFSLANERTFLSWIRTSLALTATGVALEALEVPIEPNFRLAASLLFVALATLSAVQAWLGWLLTEKAIRNQEPLRGPMSGAALTSGILLGLMIIVLGFVWTL